MPDTHRMSLYQVTRNETIFMSEIFIANETLMRLFGYNELIGHVTQFLGVTAELVAVIAFQVASHSGFVVEDWCVWTDMALVSALTVPLLEGWISGEFLG